MKDIAVQISSDEAVTSVAAAKEVLDRHNQVKAEIDAREESVQKIVKTGNKMVQQGHYAKAEVRNSLLAQRWLLNWFQIQSNLSDLQAESQKLQTLWQDQKDLFDQKLQYQLFQEEVDSLETMCNSHEVSHFNIQHLTAQSFLSPQVQLLQDKLGESVDECEVLRKKHDAFERLILSHDEKVCL